MFKVVWAEVALHELAKIWLEHSPLEINRAVNEISQILAESADVAGESRARASYRIMIVAPLRIYYSIEYHDRQQTAVVQHVWST